jgi:hypothetical protein
MDKLTAIADAFLDTFAANIKALEAALADGMTGDVYVWPQHWLGAQMIIGGKSQAVRIDRATVFRRDMSATFRNGRDEIAVRMNREQALRCALAHARKVQAEFCR